MMHSPPPFTPRQPFARSARIARTYAPPQAERYVVQIHDHDCTCPAYEPYAPSVPPRLDAVAMGKLAVAGAAVATAIAFAYDPAGAAAALLATIGL